MSEIENLGVSVEEYLDGLAAGIDMKGIEAVRSKGNSHKLGLRIDGDYAQSH